MDEEIVGYRLCGYRGLFGEATCYRGLQREEVEALEDQRQEVQEIIDLLYDIEDDVYNSSGGAYPVGLIPDLGLALRLKEQLKGLGYEFELLRCQIVNGFEQDTTRSTHGEEFLGYDVATFSSQFHSIIYEVLVAQSYGEELREKYASLLNRNFLFQGYEDAYKFREEFMVFWHRTFGHIKEYCDEYFIWHLSSVQG